MKGEMDMCIMETLTICKPETSICHWLCKLWEDVEIWLVLRQVSPVLCKYGESVKQIFLGQLFNEHG